MLCTGPLLSHGAAPKQEERRAARGRLGFPLDGIHAASTLGTDPVDPHSFEGSTGWTQGNTHKHRPDQAGTPL